MTTLIYMFMANHNLQLGLDKDIQLITLIKEMDLWHRLRILKSVLTIFKFVIVLFGVASKLKDLNESKQKITKTLKR